MKFACLAAAAAATLIATPVAAANLLVSRAPTPVVRVSVVGKADAQVTAEIRAAVTTVCGSETGACAQHATRDANRQYAAIKRSRDAATTRVEIVRQDRASVRVKVAGRSVDQIHADIDDAAKTVCRALGGADYRTCVERASRSAKAQLRDMTVAQAGQTFAAR